MAESRKRKLLRSLISASPVYTVKEYKYFVYPFKGITAVRVAALHSVTELLCNKLKANQEKFTTVATVMTDGVITALPVAMRLKKDIVIARDFHYNYHDALTIQQETGYRSRRLYVARATDIQQPVVFIDAVVSTGRTALAVIDAFRQVGVSVSRVYTVVNKVEYGGESRLQQAGISFQALFDVRIAGDQIICVDHGENLDAIKRATKPL